MSNGHLVACRDSSNRCRQVSDRQQRTRQNELHEEVEVIAGAGFDVWPSIVAVFVNHRTNGLKSVHEIAEKTQPA